MHEMLDSIPLSLNKLKAVFDLSNNTEHEGNELEFIFPFSIYHARWKELTINDLRPQAIPTNGTLIATSYTQPDSACFTDGKAVLEEDLPSIIYLRKFIEACNKRNIKVLLTYLPYPAPATEVAAANAIDDFAQELGVNYINFFDVNVVDFDVDMADANSHLNISGASKLTNYLGKYISEHYSIADHRGELKYKWMDELFAEFCDYEVALLNQQTYLHSYLPLLRNDRYACLVVLEGGTSIYENEITLKALENIYISGELNQLQYAAKAGLPYMFYINNVSGQLIEFSGNDIPFNLSTDVGSLMPSVVGDIHCMIFSGSSGELLFENYFYSMANGAFIRGK